MTILKYAISFFANLLCVCAFASVSHGPMLGDVSDQGAAVWIRTSEPEVVDVVLVNKRTNKLQKQQIKTDESADNTYIFRFTGLDESTEYSYTIKTAQNEINSNFKTHNSHEKSKNTKIVFGSCYDQNSLQNEGGRIFSKMLEQKPDTVIFTGDLPYTKQGRLTELRHNHKMFRSNELFTKLTSSIPTYAIYDDHDFGMNNSDGTFKYKDEALQAFNEYWPNPENPTRGEKGIYTSFVINNVEVFLLDTRYFSRQSEQNPDMLGEKQFSWLCSGLKSSPAKYKIIVSGVSLSSTNNDGWNGKFYAGNKSALYSCIYDNEISGVFMISGDSHRSEIHKHRLGGWLSENYLYDLTSSPLKTDVIKDNWQNDDALVYNYKEEDSLFAELILSAEAQPMQVIFKIMSPIHGEVKRLTLDSSDLAVNKATKRYSDTEMWFVIIFIIVLAGYSVYRKVY
jgi:alkaline phosphatase D